jgi:hypothetical protein
MKVSKNLLVLGLAFISVTVLATTFARITINKIPSVAQVDRLSSVRVRATALYGNGLLRGPTRGDIVPAKWSFKGPRGRGRYEHIGGMGTITYKELSFHLAGQASRRRRPTPLLIDMNNDGFQLSAAGIGVEFDISSTGTPSNTQWVAEGTDDAFLVRDLNNNGKIDGGAELFGSGTRLEVTGGLAVDGYIALMQYDGYLELGGNRDRSITPKDKVWNELLLWNDSNADGLTDPGELSTPLERGIKAIELRMKYMPKRYVLDAAGNALPVRSRVLTNHGVRWMTDVFFNPIGA